MIMFLAGLTALDKSVVESGPVDGAHGWRLWWHVILPGIRSTVIFVFVMLVIGSLQAFISIFLLTAGGPYNSTQVLLTYTYQMAFSFFNFGYAAALATHAGGSCCSCSARPRSGCCASGGQIDDGPGRPRRTARSGAGGGTRPPGRDRRLRADLRASRWPTCCRCRSAAWAACSPPACRCCRSTRPWATTPPPGPRTTSPATS